MKIKCDKCGEEMEVPGALIFSPMEKRWDDRVMDHKPITEKYHICVNCWEELKKWISDTLL